MPKITPSGGLLRAALEFPQQESHLEAVLYTRVGCHLCEDAEALLMRFGVNVRLVDIDQDPELAARYGTWVPVVMLDGQERFRGHVDELLLRRLLAKESNTQAKRERGDPA